MKMHAPALVLLAIYLMVSLHCSTNNNVAGGPGTGSETTNGIVVSSTGVPEVAVSVMLIDQSNWLDNSVSNTSFIIDSTITNSDGHFEFSKPLPEIYSLQIIGTDEGLVIKNAESILRKDNLTPTFALKRYGTYKGSVRMQSGSANTVLIAGTTFRATIQDSGTFEVTAIPEGEYSVFAEVTNTQSPELVLIGVVDIPSGTTIIQNDIDIYPNIIVCEDFNDNDFEYTILGAITGGYWYNFIDSREDDGHSSLNFRVTSENAYSGSSFTGSIILRDGYQYPYGGVGFFMGDYKEYDLSGMTKLSFWAKGHGKLRVACETALLDDANMQDHFGYIVTLGSAWQKFEISPDSLSLPYDNSDFSWEEAAGHVRRIEFEMSRPYNSLDDTLSFSLDNIYIEGVSVDALLQSEKAYTLR